MVITFDTVVSGLVRYFGVNLVVFINDFCKGKFWVMVTYGELAYFSLDWDYAWLKVFMSL